MFNSLFPEYPGTDYQRYNLHWIIETCKKAEKITTDLEKEISDKVNEIVREILSGDGVSAFIKQNTVLRIQLADHFPGTAFEPGQIVQTMGYHSAGVGACLYAIEDIARRGAILISENPVVFANPIEAHTPEQFGAYADGLHDDSGAVELACETGLCILTDRARYRIGNRIDIVNDCAIVGNASTLIRDIADIEIMFMVRNVNAIFRDFKIVDGANVANSNEVRPVVFDNCDLVIIDGCEWVSKVRANWYCTVSCNNLVVDDTIIDNSYAQYEWGDGLHVVKADTVKIANSSFFGGDDALAFVSQGNVGVTDGTIRDVVVNNCVISSPKYSGLKIGRYKVSNPDSITEPESVVFNGCTFRDCDRWVTLLQYYTTYNRCDVMFNGCVFYGNHSKANQQPFNSTTADAQHGGAYHVVFTGCTIRDTDVMGTNGLINVASYESLSMMGCDISTIGNIIVDSSRDTPSIMDVVFMNNRIVHSGSDIRALNNGSINGDVTFMNNMLTATGSKYSHGYFYSFAVDNNYLNIVGNMFNENLVGEMFGANYTVANNVVKGTH